MGHYRQQPSADETSSSAAPPSGRNRPHVGRSRRGVAAAGPTAPERSPARDLPEGAPEIRPIGRDQVERQRQAEDR